MHGDPFAPLILSLALILSTAKVSGHLAARLGQPPVLGELGAGVVLGNLTLAGFSGLESLKNDAALETLAQLGAILLLFQVGLESTVTQMLEVGRSSFFVATLGVVGPFLLGWGVGAWLLPDASIYVHVFLGATLTATSVGITARVLKDLGRSKSNEARIILGAAVIDDVLGLVILAIVTGVIAAANQNVALSFGAIGLVVLKSTLFLVGALALSIYASPSLFSLAATLDASGVLLAFGLAFCFALAGLASFVGLAPIVGAFAAGLVLEDRHDRSFVDRGERSLQHLVEPIASFMAPIFFVMIGLRTDLRAFNQPGILGLAAVLTLAALAGKLLCAFGVVAKGDDRLSVAIGMTPRGEVGLIFANIGLTLVLGGERILNQNTFSAVVIMVIATTVITPPALKWSFERRTTRFQAQGSRL